eukprot:1608366-Amphidinium_carterae.1
MAIRSAKAFAGIGFLSIICNSFCPTVHSLQGEACHAVRDVLLGREKTAPLPRTYMQSQDGTYRIRVTDLGESEASGRLKCFSGVLCDRG